MFDKIAFQDEDFSWQAALNLALVSDQAYNSESAIRDEAEKWGFSQFTFLDNDDTQAFVAADDETVLIGFRGTEANFADWFGNLKVIPKDTGRYGTVHSGFHGGYHNVHTDLVSFLSKVKAQDKNVWIAGHSLGGALALIAGAELYDQYAIAGIHTIGQPRTGNNAFLDFYDQNYGDRYIRIVNDRDVVARVPPLYGHTGKLYWFDEDGELQQVGRTRSADGVELGSPEPPPLTDAEFADLQQRMLKESATRGSFSGALSAVFPGVADHDRARYIDLIRAQVDLANEI